MSKTIITLFLLFLSAIADSTITIHCSLCDNHVCMNVNGGPFTHFSIPYPQKSCSQVGGIVPANYTFTCSSQCPEGCLLTIEERSVRSLCTNQFMTQTVINQLDLMYSAQQKDIRLESKYDWCGCPPKPKPPKSSEEVPPEGLSQEAKSVIFILKLIVAAGTLAFLLIRKKLEEDQSRAICSETHLTMEQNSQ